MSWTIKTNKGLGKYSETYTLPSSATVGYSTIIDASKVGPDKEKLNRYVTFTFKASAVSGTNLDIALYGCDSDGTNPVILKDAVVADITTTSLVAGVVDLNAYPYLYYKLGWTADADESANTITVGVYH